MTNPFKLSRCSLLLSLFASLWFISGCDKVDSEDIRTSGVYADFYISASTADQTRVRADLRTGSGLFADKIVLSPGDALTARIGGTTNTLSRNSVDNYETVFDINADGSDVYIAFDRVNDTDAPDSWVTVPKSFNIDAPGAGEVFVSGGSISIIWTPAVASGTIDITIYGSCTSTGEETISFSEYFDEIPDVGSYPIPVNTVLYAHGRLQSNFDPDFPCPATIRLERGSFGTIDPNFGQGGVISASQSRTINIVFDP